MQTEPASAEGVQQTLDAVVERLLLLNRVVEHLGKAGEGGVGQVFKNACFWYILKQEEIRLQNCADVRKTLVTAASSWAWMFSNHVGRSFYRFVTLTPDGFSALPQPVQLGSILLLRFTNGPLCHCPRSQELR